jgi:hypothetical protein
MAMFQGIHLRKTGAIYRKKSSIPVLVLNMLNEVMVYTRTGRIIKYVIFFTLQVISLKIYVHTIPPGAS